MLGVQRDLCDGFIYYLAWSVKEDKLTRCRMRDKDGKVGRETSWRYFPGRAVSQVDCRSWGSSLVD
jgi:hypothetical protein